MGEIERIIEKIEAIPIDEIIGGEIALKGSGVERDALCPFHNDRKLGNFKVNTGKNLWKCFSCGESGKGGVSFYQRLHGLSWKRAAADVGLRYGAITRDEAEILLKEDPDEIPMDCLPAKHTLEKPSVNEKLPPEMLDRVYRLFIRACPPMSAEARKKLIEERALGEEDMRFFFAMPEYSACLMAVFLRSLAAEGIDRSVLGHTPGFYFDMRNRNYRFVGAGKDALGIIACDETGRINGIQIRRKTEDKKKRYIWFSSGFANGSNPGCDQGTTNSGVVDVLPGTKSNILICTEGKFKALKLNKMGYTVLNMHGVTCWPYVKVVQFAKSHHIETIVLCYDADVSMNDSVAKAALNFSKKLTFAGIQVKYMVWDISYGKGVDDMINNGYQEELSMRDSSWYNHYVLEPLVNQQFKEKMA